VYQNVSTYNSDARESLRRKNLKKKKKPYTHARAHTHTHTHIHAHKSSVWNISSPQSARFKSSGLTDITRCTQPKWVATKGKGTDTHTPLIPDTQYFRDKWQKLNYSADMHRDHTAIIRWKKWVGICKQQFVLVLISHPMQLVFDRTYWYRK